MRSVHIGLLFCFGFGDRLYSVRRGRALCSEAELNLRAMQNMLHRIPCRNNIKTEHFYSVSLRANFRARWRAYKFPDRLETINVKAQLLIAKQNNLQKTKLPLRKRCHVPGCISGLEHRCAQLPYVPIIFKRKASPPPTCFHYSRKARRRLKS